MTYHTQLAYDSLIKATFVELPPFQRYRQDYLDDDSFRAFQQMLMENPEAGDVREGTGGLRKVRFADEKRGKGKRGGLRVIYPKKRSWQGGRGEFIRPNNVLRANEFAPTRATQRVEVK